MSKFEDLKIGDRVEVVDNIYPNSCSDQIGMTGVIADLFPEEMVDDTYSPLPCVLDTGYAFHPAELRKVTE